MLAMLKKHFGYDSFRGGQEELVSAILSNRDTLGIMPTGAGKSICFQLPALGLPGITLVVSPLISLMKDQVDTLRQSGIPAAFINSSLTAGQMALALANAASGQYKLIYIAPERLSAPDFFAFARANHISMLTVDEAHCISQWGQDFRPSYAQIPAFIKALPQRPIVSAFTATATAHVREDIVRLLELQEPLVMVTGFDRDNLYFDVQSPGDKMAALLGFLRDRPEKSGIVYCAARKSVEEVCEALNRNGITASRYHAGLSDEERKRNQDDFLYDRVRVMAATNAFGMGIDKSNVGFVVHYNMPKDIESYYQEAGRAGRDGSASDCLLLYSGQDVVMANWMIENARDVTYPDEETEALLKARARSRLRDMTFYATTNECLRAYILKYFGERPPSFCDNCGNCHTHFDTVDITEDAQKIVSCVARMRERFGAGMVADVLRGANSARIREMGLDRLSTYGICTKNSDTIRAILEYLVQTGYLIKTDDQYPVVKLGERAREALAAREPIVMKLAQAKENAEGKAAKTKKSKTMDVSPECRVLFERLRALRQEIATDQKVPAFVVFSDRSLIDMCAKLPCTESAFLEVMGVGEAKMRSYGALFIAEIKRFRDETGLEAPAKAKAGKKPKKGERVLPDDEILRLVPIVKEPVALHAIASAMRAVLTEHGCSTFAAAKISDWLVFAGHLQVMETESGRNKVPTGKGAELGITQEARVFESGTYMVNLYNEAAQRFVVMHMREAVLFEKADDGK